LELKISTKSLVNTICFCLFFFTKDSSSSFFFHLRDFTQLLTKNYDDGIVIVVRVQFLGLQSRRAEWFLAEIKKKVGQGWA